MKDNEWKEGLPSKKGLYWIYSYRYGKGSVGREEEPELMLAKVVTDNGLITADGQMVFKSEVECPYHKDAKPYLPTLPKMPY